MASLVSQAEAMAQLRLNELALTQPQIDDVMFKAEQASAIIVDYLKRPFIEGPITPQPVAAATPKDWSDMVPPAGWPGGIGWGDPVAPSVPPIPPPAWTPANVPVLVKGVILVVLTSLYDGRTPDDGLLTPAITAVLERYRD